MSEPSWDKELEKIAEMTKNYQKLLPLVNIGLELLQKLPDNEIFEIGENAYFVKELREMFENPLEKDMIINSQPMYKIVDYINGSPKTLFHGLNGTKTLPIGEWVQADKKVVRDGPNSTPYLSGWHVLPTIPDCLAYLKKFTNIQNKVIMSCRVRDVWDKKHSPSPVKLAGKLKLLEVVLHYTKDHEVPV